MKFNKLDFNFDRVQLKRLLKIAFYTCAGTFMVFLTIFLVALAQGYDYDFRTGELNVQGMVIIDSTPRGASVLVNGEPIGRNTPRRRLITAGTHDFALTHPDYRQWQKRALVLAGKVTFLEYPVLILNNIVTDNLLAAPAVSVFTQSPNGRLAVISPDSESLQLLDTREGVLEEIYRLEAELSDAGSRITSAQWAADNRRVLLGVSGGESAQRLVIDTANPENLFDLSAELAVGSGRLVFSADTWQELFWFSSAGLRHIDIGGGVVSPVLATEVSDLSAAEDVFYVAVAAEGKAIYRLNADLSSELVAADLAAGDYRLQQLEFSDEPVLALLETATGQVTLYNLATESEPRLLNATADSMLASSDGRFLLLQQGQEFAAYSSESKGLYRFTLTEEFSDIRWAGKYHLSAVADGKAVLFEYDGGNQEEIVSAEAGFGVLVAPNYRYMYSIGTSAVGGGRVLQTSQLQR